MPTKKDFTCEKCWAWLMPQDLRANGQCTMFPQWVEKSPISWCEWGAEDCGYESPTAQRNKVTTIMRSERQDNIDKLMEEPCQSES